MTVPTEAAYAELLWTGVETAFAPGFTAENVGDVAVSYLDADDLPVPLTRVVHFNVSLDSALNVTVTPVALPTGSPGDPVTLIFERNTTAVQGTEFSNLHRYSATVHGTLFDRAFRVLAEVKARVLRRVGPFSTTDDVVDFRPRRVMAAEPVGDSDLATKLYADAVSGVAAQAGAEAARDIAIAQATIATTQAGLATGAAALAETYADILGNPDYGFYTDIPTTTRDYGTYV
jgi:hypothetical protein